MFCLDVLGMLLGCEWGKVAAMVLARGGSKLHDKGAIGSAYTLLY